ncbi:3-deoxy-D-arabinoheptulosonate-7-phosphate synthase [Saccharopolyspora kobensis]|uniref:Phospho-2-dehydro-3-deoxyheptonate aldolase n=1 Tax=Saccharopolyspora kobensis TaxID=146035 RepID=A0A1H5UXL7_9PSEU|nr:3-deoxy-7-phosphoheptulonate synthase [Saccharopolyspora kobensis]SEF79835.1 3-deoxy-D-arabinoheptulosonate-7-phosphate synthase [Saccharopolyspora kobensis]SFC67693.1 3-deoxy-D-arabinoheptulosonate-7-phosphate synthase [Saccharopolyspora kobensis]
MTLSLNTAAAAQQPDWPDGELVERARRTLSDLPGLTTEDEIDSLREVLAAAALGEALVLQGGDCAERFADAEPSTVRRKLDHLQGVASVLRSGAELPVVTIGRIAGQYAKPRSTSHEKLPDGRSLPSYRGDAVNDIAADPVLRTPDPDRLLTAYHSARAVLDTMRSSWIGRPAAERVYAAHELLLLPYEEPLVRSGSTGKFAASAHFGWVGERTRDIGGAHVRLAESVQNPIGVKIGPAVTPVEAVELVHKLNPDRIPGRLTLIVRMGAGEVGRRLPLLVEEVSRHAGPVVWLSDPMHGNTSRTSGGVKTRFLPAVLEEVTTFVRVLRERGQWPAGLHLELTPDPVTECVDGPERFEEHLAFPDYRSVCDPRLNPAQAAQVVDAFLLAAR